MATEVEIANQALLLLGEGLITSGQLTTPDDKKSRLVSAMMTLSRRAVLRDCRPNCARAYADLTTPGMQLHPDHAYTNALPADCLRVVTVLEGLSSSTNYSSIGRPVISRWRILTGDEIGLDYQEACIEYVKDIATTLFDVLTDEALAHYLAWKMAVPLTESTTKRDEMAKAYAALKEQLSGSDEVEGNHDRFTDATRLIAARHGTSYGGW